MTMSSRGGNSQRFAGLEIAVISQQCPDQVDQSAGKREDCGNRREIDSQGNAMPQERGG